MRQLRLFKSSGQISLAVLAAVLYCSWPLGFVLNASVAQHSLVSQLEASRQPYNWVFIVMDVAAGFLAIFLGLKIAFKRKLVRGNQAIAWGLIIFGALVAAAAIVPVDCDPSEGVCGSLWRHPELVAHGLASIISVLGLFLALLITALHIHLRHNERMVRMIYFALVGAWIAFGVGSLFEIFLKIHSNLLQYYFISICSLSIPAIVGGHLWLVKYKGRQHAR